MPIDQQWVRDVPRYDRSVIHVHIVNVIHYVYALALARVGRLHDPHVLLRVVLLQLLIVRVEVPELVREDVGVGHKVKVLLAVLLLHADHVKTEAVLPGDLVALWEVVDLLVLVEALVEVALARAGAPKDIPLM